MLRQFRKNRFSDYALIAKKYNDYFGNNTHIAYNEKIVNLMRFYLSQFRERTSSSANNMILVLSFLFLFEATVFAKYSPSSFTWEILTYHAVPIILFFIANCFFIVSLVLSLLANEKMVVIIPLFDECIPIPLGNEEDYHAKWLVKEFAYERMSLDYAQVAKIYVRTSHSFALVGVTQAFIGVIWSVFFSQHISLQTNLYTFLIVIALILVVDGLFILVRMKKVYLGLTSGEEAICTCRNMAELLHGGINSKMHDVQYYSNLYESMLANNKYKR